MALSKSIVYIKSYLKFDYKVLQFIKLNYV